MATKDARDNKIELVKMKLPFVLRDYQSYFEAESREAEKITQLRSWEAALISGLCVVVLTGQKPIELLSGAPLIFVVIVFSFLEAKMMSDLKVLRRNVLDLEKRLQTDDPKKFKENINNWTYGNTFLEEKKQSRLQRYKNIIRELIRPTVLLWHGGLALVIIALALLSR